MDCNEKHQNAHLLLSIEYYSDQNEQAGEIKGVGVVVFDLEFSTALVVPGGIHGFLVFSRDVRRISIRE